MKKKNKKHSISKIKGRKIIFKRKSKGAIAPQKAKKILFKTSIAIILVLVLVAISIQFYKAFPREDKIELKFNGKKEVTLEVFKPYKEKGIKLEINNKDVTESIIINGKVNSNKTGFYKIKYIYNNKAYASRTVHIVDTEKPKLNLNGESEISLIETSNYIEQGAKATDNYDGDITNKIKITGNVDTTKIGEYTITYTVKDSSSNEEIITRKVVVTEKPKTIVKKVVVEENTSSSSVETLQPEISLTNSGFSINSCTISNIVPTSLSLNDTVFSITVSNNCYVGTLDITNLSNGTYNLYVNSINGKEDAIDNQSEMLKVKRAKIGNKLVTFSYPNNKIVVTIEDFAYQYDILIDVGHGGWDTGATNIYNQEKDMNLIVSLYEKAKYEEAGLRVLMIRTDDSYGAGMGDLGKALYNRAYYMGYYGVVSKVVYSNHHNSSYGGASGFEMYTSNSMSNMSTEIGIYSEISKISKANNIYARDYWTGNLYSKVSGQVYNYKNYYAILRIPSELFNLNNITIYESCYLSNVDDYINYWNNENWKKISDIKVRNYINKING